MDEKILKIAVIFHGEEVVINGASVCLTVRLQCYSLFSSYTWIILGYIVMMGLHLIIGILTEDYLLGSYISVYAEWKSTI